MLWSLGTEIPYVGEDKTYVVSKSPVLYVRIDSLIALQVASSRTNYKSPVHFFPRTLSDEFHLY